MTRAGRVDPVGMHELQTEKKKISVCTAQSPRVCFKRSEYKYNNCLKSCVVARVRKKRQDHCFPVRKNIQHGYVTYMLDAYFTNLLAV